MPIWIKLIVFAPFIAIAAGLAVAWFHTARQAGQPSEPVVSEPSPVVSGDSPSPAPGERDE